MSQEQCADRAQLKPSCKEKLDEFRATARLDAVDSSTAPINHADEEGAAGHADVSMQKSAIVVDSDEEPLANTSQSAPG
jgi:hypothetical protein